MRGMMVVSLVMALTTGAGAANPPLREVAAIDDGVFAVAVADRIRKRCPEISARMLTAFRFMRALERRALEMGYTEAEIEAYLDSDAEKTRLKARGAAYLAENGVTEDPATYCALGRAEIEKSSRIGTLLRMN